MLSYADEPLVSVIVPVYNAEKYLKKCLNSILLQSYKNIEIILINDGSKDSSGKICEYFKSIDNRIIYIEIDNQGVSHARNMGIQESKGEYIFFVDSDDWVSVDYIKNMIAVAIDSETMLVVSSVINVYNNRRLKRQIPKILSGALQDVFDKFYDYLRGPGYKCYSSKVIKNNKIFFDENVSYGEDRIFNYNYLSFVDSLKFVDSSCYFVYKNHEGSLSKIKSKKNFEDCLNRMDIALQFFKNNKIKHWEPIFTRYSFSIISEFLKIDEEPSSYHAFSERAHRVFEKGKSNFIGNSFIDNLKIMIYKHKVYYIAYVYMKLKVFFTR